MDFVCVEREEVWIYVILFMIKNILAIVFEIYNNYYVNSN